MDAVVVAFEGRALNWFQWWENQAVLRTWDEFTVAVKRRFCLELLKNPMGPLLSLKQETTVMEYRERFELHMAPLHRDERVMLESIFLNDSKTEIKAELKLYEYEDLADLMDRDFMIEEKNMAMSKKQEPVKEKQEWKGTNSKFRSTWGSSKGEGSSSTGSEKKVYEGMKGRHLGSAELEERSKKGLCFKCGEKWNRAHVCKFKHMKLMLCEIDEDDGEEDSGDLKEEPVITETEMKSLLLSLQSKEGLTSNKSFKVCGIINGRLVLILIDSSATSNFIAPKLVKELMLLVEDTPVYLVELGSSEMVRNSGACKGLKFTVQEIEFSQNFFLMELGGVDLVLGMDWLASLGNIEAKFRNLSLKWTQGDQQFAIHGEPALCTVQASWKSLVKVLQEEGEGYLVDCLAEQKEAEFDASLWENTLTDRKAS